MALGELKYPKKAFERERQTAMHLRLTALEARVKALEERNAPTFAQLKEEFIARGGKFVIGMKREDVLAGLEALDRQRDVGETL
jgi:hypothetical protein